MDAKKKFAEYRERIGYPKAKDMESEDDNQSAIFQTQDCGTKKPPTASNAQKNG